MTANMFCRFNGNGPANAEMIAKVQHEIGLELPQEYAEFLQRMNGGEGFVGQNYIMLWRVEELKGMNDAYGVNRQAANLVLFGSDGGDEGFAFTIHGARKFVAVPLLGTDLSLARVCGSSFTELVKSLSVLPLSDFLIVGLR